MKLIPADKKRCQAEMPNGANAFTLGGVPAMVRCSNKPIAIVTETQADPQGQRGSMSLCADCLEVASKQLGEEAFTVQEIDEPQLRGMLTMRIKEESKRVLGYEITQVELRLMPYLISLAMDGGRIDPAKINEQEIEIIKDWRSKHWVVAILPRVILSIGFWDACCRLVYLGYVDLD